MGSDRNRAEEGTRNKVLVGVVGDISFLGFDEAQHCG